MRYNYALPALALAGSAIAAPVVVTETNIVYVTAAATTAPAVSASHAPQVGAVYEVVVSKLVEIEATTTETHITTFTRTKNFNTEATASGSASASASAETTSEAAPAPAETTTSSPVAVEAAVVETSQAPEPTSTKETTTLAPTTSAAPATTTTTSSSTQAAATTTAASSSGADSSFASAILAEHNAKRALHGVSDLEWSSTLADYAQAYADAYDCSGTLTHSGGQYGENLGLGYTTTGVVDAWYNEISEYSYSSPSASHFTQVVWKSTTQLGCGYKTCGSYWGQYTICSYQTPGNVAGQYAANVLPLV